MGGRQAFFLEGAAGRRFLLYSPPAQDARLALLCLPPFAEEMNKTRRALTSAVRCLVAAGHAVLQPDLQGCGDSEGDFEDASWQQWLDDGAQAAEWLRRALPSVPLLLWGVRGGSLLASALADRVNAAGMLWWQPTSKGAVLLQQWLRLRLAAEIEGNAARTSTAEMKASLMAGKSVDVAGYRLRIGLSQGLEAAILVAPKVPTLWLEASSQAGAELLPASSKLLTQWQGAPVQALALNDASPWAALELRDLPALTQASLEWLDGWRR